MVNCLNNHSTCILSFYERSEKKVLAAVVEHLHRKPADWNGIE